MDSEDNGTPDGDAADGASADGVDVAEPDVDDPGGPEPEIDGPDVADIDIADPDSIELAESDDAPAAAPAPRPSATAPVVKKEKVLPPKAKAKAKTQGAGSGRVTPAASETTRYTSPSTTQVRRPSPIWVPILMFGLWGFGLLIIALNYMDVLPGTGDGGNGWYLIAGLVAILGGIVAATKYH